MNATESAHVQAALLAQGGALSALFTTHPDPARLQRAYLEQIEWLTGALQASNAPKEFWTALRTQADGLVSQLPR